jgi:CheY-like chemotaxis protein
VRISVRDSGIGIPSSKLSAIFEAFGQAEASTARTYGGTGLGLAICTQLARLLGGTIGVDSVEGEGSTFWLSIPLELHDPPVDAAGEPEARLAGGLGDARPRVLLVEDDLTNRRFIYMTLRRIGCEIDVAENGRRAVEMACAGEYALIFMDCQLPVMDGFDATREIRKAANGGRRVPIIAVTAHVMPESRERCREAGMDDFLPKPIGFRELREVLQRYLAVDLEAAAPRSTPAPPAE